MNSTILRRHAVDIILLLFSGAGIIICLGIALLTLGLAVACYVEGDRESALAIEWAAFALGFLALCGLPTLCWSVRALLGKETPQPERPHRRWAWIALPFPLSLALGAAARESEVLSAVVGPVAQVTAASVPVGMVVLLARRIGPPTQPRRVWGQFLLGLWLVPTAAIGLELALLLPVAAVALVALSLTPEGKTLLEALVNPMLSPETNADQIANLAGTPWMIALTLFYVALLVPLVEESLKTMGVWPLLFGARPSTGEGFLSGVLTGAGFALAEALFMPQPGPLWLAGILMRVAGTVVHSFTGGLSCWGAVESLHVLSPWPFVRRFAAAVFLHGAWNAAIVLIWATTLAFEADIPAVSYSLANSLTLSSSLALALLMVVAAIGLPWAARRSLRSSPSGTEFPTVDAVGL